MSHEQLPSNTTEPADDSLGAARIVVSASLGRYFSAVDVDPGQLALVMRGMGMTDEQVQNEPACIVDDGPEDSPEGITQNPLTIHIGHYAWRFAHMLHEQEEVFLKNRSRWLTTQVAQDMVAQITGVPYEDKMTIFEDPVVNFEFLDLGYYHTASGITADGDVFDTYRIRAESEHENMSTALVVGRDKIFEDEEGPLTRLHSRCIYSEVFGSLDCDCHRQLELAKARIREKGAGVLIILEQEGRGAGLLTKAMGYALKKEKGLDTSEAYHEMGVEFDSRKYENATAFLKALGLKKIRLMSNNPRKLKAVKDAGIEPAREEIIIPDPNYNDYLGVKRDKAGHLFPSEL